MKPSKTFLKFYAIFLIFLAILIGMTAGVIWLDHQDRASEEKLSTIHAGTNDPLPDHLAPGIEKTLTRLAEIDASLTATSITATAIFITPYPTNQ